MEIKLLSLDNYRGMLAEIESNLELVEGSNLNEMMTQYQHDLEEKMSELREMKAEHTKLTTEVNDKYHLDKWCGGCKEMWGNCNQRVQYLKDKYGNPVLGSKIEIMGEGKCLNKR